LVQRQVGDQLLQPGVFFLELLELSDRIDFQPDILFPPSIEGLSFCFTANPPFSGIDFAGN
jgi:hypothetical protein